MEKVAKKLHHALSKVQCLSDPVVMNYVRASKIVHAVNTSRKGVSLERQIQKNACERLCTNKTVFSKAACGM